MKLWIGPMIVKIFDPDPGVVASLKAAFKTADTVGIEIEQTETMLYLKPPQGLDALYLPLAAAERWGSRPQIHLSQVIPIPAEDQHAGLPPFIVTGTCLSPDDPRGSVPELTILLRSVAHAIEEANRMHGYQINCIGFWAYNLLKGVTPQELSTLVQLAFGKNNLNC